MQPNGRPVTYHDGARIEWTGWRQSPNQDITLGWWLATKPGLAVVATTLGGIEQLPADSLGTSPPFGVLNVTVTDDEYGHDHRDASEAAKERAIDRLRHWLDDHASVTR